MGEEGAPLERVAGFLARAERCRQRYLPVIARGSAWAFSLLLASGLAAAAGEAAGAFVAAVAVASVAGYLALSWWLLYAGRLVPGLLGGRREGALLALLIAVLAAFHASGLLPGWSGGGVWVAALLALPTLRRILLGARLLGPAAPAAGLVLLGLGFWLLLQRGLACGFVGLVAAAEVLMVAAAAGRMIGCGEEAAETLLAGAT